MAKNRWKSNPRLWMRHSSDENAIHRRENVLQNKNDAFLSKNRRKAVRKMKKLGQMEESADEIRECYINMLILRHK